MSSKKIIFLILLLMIGMAGQAFVAQATVVPTLTTVPKGAYVNGPLGAADDNYFWQTVTITTAATHTNANITVTLTLPLGMTVADIDGIDGNGVGTFYDEDISLTLVQSAGGTDDILTLTATNTTANAVIVNVTSTAAGLEIGDIITVMFPVETSLSPPADTDDYYISFDDGASIDDIADGSGPVITFVDPAPNAIGAVTFAAALMKDAATGFYDSTLADGEIYPAVTTIAYTAALPDYINDIDVAGAKNDITIAAITIPAAGTNLPADVATTFLGTAASVVVNDDTYFRVYASTDSTLNHVNADDTGVILLRNHTVGAAPFNTYDYSHELHTGAQGFTVANLPEGDWYIYVVNSLTGDFPLGRSDKLTVTHFPQVDVFAWDYDSGLTLDGGTAGLESGTVPGDSEDMTLDSGLFYAPEGAVFATGIHPTDPVDDVDLHISVDDFDDDAVVTLFYSVTTDLDSTDVVTSGTSPDRVVTGLTGATLIVDNLEENQEDEDGFLVYNWAIDSTVPAAVYTLYAVATDGKNLNVKPVMGLDDTKPPTYSGTVQLKMDVKHSPDLVLDSLDEYNLGTDTGDVADLTIDPFQTDVIMISWGKSSVDGDKDIDDSCTIEFWLDEVLIASKLVPAFGSDGATLLRAAATAHEIIVGLPEDPEGKGDSYYTWNLKEDWIANAGAWAPVDQAAGTTVYHLYGIITEGEGLTERVVCLGITDTFKATVASTPTVITFDNVDAYAKLYDPPLEGVTIGATDTYRMNFEVFDIDADQEVGIFIVKEVAGEWISNGDFEAGTTGWTLGASWSVSGGEAIYDKSGGANNLDQAFAVANATQYTVSFDLSGYSGAGTVDVTLGADAVGSFATDGSYSVTLTTAGGASGLGIIFIPSAATFDVTIDNVSVIEGTGAYTDGMVSTTIGDISAGNLLDGDAYALTSDDGTLAAHVTYPWLSDDDDTFYDVSLWTPGAGAGRYTDNLSTASTVALADGNYWVYIGVNTGAANFGTAGTPLYRAPGLLTISGLIGGNEQQNISMEPRKFVSTIGDIDTISARAYSAIPVDIIDLYIAVDKTFFDLDDESTPFIDAGFTTATLVSNTAIDDDANGRWVLHATFTNSGDDIAPTSGGIGDELVKFAVVGKGTDTAIGETTSFSYLNEPANGYVTKFVNDGVDIPFIATAVAVDVRPRGIIDGIVEFEGRASSSAIVTLNLRDRGSYVPTDDATFIEANDGEQEGIEGKIDAALYAPDGIQFRLDNDGKFTLYQVPEGEWELYVYYERYLAEVIDVDITAGLDALLVDFGQLLGGDCIGYTDENYDAYPNNAINQQDVNRINAAYDSTSASPWWDTETNPVDGGKYNYKWADIDEDDLVGILDLTIVTGHFTYGGSANLGAQPVYMKPAVGDFESNMNAFVEFMNVPVELKAGQTYTIQIVIDNAVNVKGYDLRMDYDHSALTFVNIEKGDFIKDESNSFSINSGDTIGLVNTVYGPTAYSGAGILAEVSFSANRDGIFTSNMLGISQALVVDNNYIAFDLFAADAPTGVGTAKVPVEFALTQNFPNPFNPTTMINFSIPMSSNVEIKVYNILGRHVRTLVSGAYDAGNYSVVWNATDVNGNLVSNGVYFYTIRAADYSLTKKMLFMK